MLSLSLGVLETYNTQVYKLKVFLLCALPGLAPVLPKLLVQSPVLKNDMLYAYFCYFWDFHKDWSLLHPFPLWSSSYQCGMPMHAYWQSGYLYPVTWVLFGPLSPHIGILLFYAFHFSLGIYGFLKLGPCLRLKPFAAYWAGICFALSGTMLARHEHATFLAGWAWMPLVLAAFLRLRAAPGPKNVCLYAGAVALQTLGGHPQASAATAVLIGCFTVGAIRRACLRSETTGSLGSPSSRRSLAWIVGGHLLALIWCLPLLIPFADLVQSTVRYDSSGWETGVTGKIPTVFEHSDFTFFRFSTGSFRALHLLSLLAPNILGSPSNASWWGGELWGEVFLYIGGLGLFFCLFASPRRASRDLLWLWAIGLIGLWFAFGYRLGASQLLYRLPFFNHLRIPARWLILFVFALATLSAHGFQRFAARPRRGRALSVALVVALALASLFAALHSARALYPLLLHFANMLQPLPNPDKDYFPKLSLLLSKDILDFVLLTISAGTVWLFVRLGKRFLPALYLILLLDLLRVHWEHFSLFPSSYYREPPASAVVLDTSTRPFWRVNHALEYGESEKWMMHNDPVAHFGLLEREKTVFSYGIHAIFGYRHVSAYLPLMWPWESGLTPAGKSDRYLFTNFTADHFAGDGLQWLGKFGDVYAYEVEGWKPRFESLRLRMTTGAMTPMLAMEVPHAMLTVTPVQTMPAERDVDSSRSSTACAEGFSGYRDLCVRELRDGFVIVRGNWKAGDTLLFRERFATGWRYRVEGGAWKPVRETASHFMALLADRDAAGMEIEYHPGKFFALAGFSYGLPALLGGLGLLIRRLRRRRTIEPTDAKA